jgi:hypothetical protein
MHTPNKEVNKLMRQARKQGWNIMQIKNGHLKWVSPVGAIMYSSFSPSDVNAVKQIQRDLVLNGFITLKKGK